MTNKKLVITGAAHGIGRAIALTMAKRGCDIGMFEIDSVAAQSVAKDITALGRKAYVEICDVTKKEQVETASEKLLTGLGHCDILVNNAGICRMGELLTMEETDWRDLFAVNVDGVFHVTRAIAPSMVERGQGAIVNLSSWMGKSGHPGYGAYCATKFAIIGLTQTLALELGPKGVRVNAVAPGLIVNTVMREEAENYMKERGMPMAAERSKSIPLRRSGMPQDIANAVAFLASDEASYVTGEVVNVTGGHWNG
ncbi:MAG: SDR family oxidoreductase [Methylocystaceae bacterium]|nr:SDR family oxidoreductase [Methylocystaceae bacterium]